jgi:hypothetical protein
MRRITAGACVVALGLVGGLAGGSPAGAADQNNWRVTAFFSKPAWKASVPKAKVLKACRNGTGGSAFKLGTPVTVLDSADTVVGSAPVTKVVLWKEGGRYICKFTAVVPIAPSNESLFLIKVADTNAHLYGLGDLEADGWAADFWPIS